jgi:hypothetical protein
MRLLLPVVEAQALALYEHGNFNRGQDGRNLLLNGSIGNVGSFNDLTSSIKISRGSSGRSTQMRIMNKLLFTRGPGRTTLLFLAGSPTIE